jgi:hypothetical protein
VPCVALPAAVDPRAETRDDDLVGNAQAARLDGTAGSAGSVVHTSPISQTHSLGPQDIAAIMQVFTAHCDALEARMGRFGDLGHASDNRTNPPGI